MKLKKNKKRALKAPFFLNMCYFGYEKKQKTTGFRL